MLNNCVLKTWFQCDNYFFLPFTATISPLMDQIKYLRNQSAQVVARETANFVSN